MAKDGILEIVFVHSNTLRLYVPVCSKHRELRPSNHDSRFTTHKNIFDFKHPRRFCYNFGGHFDHSCGKVIVEDRRVPVIKDTTYQTCFRS